MPPSTLMHLMYNGALIKSHVRPLYMYLYIKKPIQHERAKRRQTHPSQGLNNRVNGGGENYIEEVSDRGARDG